MTLQQAIVVSWCGNFLLILLHLEIVHCTVTNYNSYEVVHKTPEIAKSDKRISLPAIDKNNRRGEPLSRSDKVGNVIFDDNVAFTSSSVDTRARQYSTDDVARGLLRNHRLEGPLSSQEIASTAQAAAATAALTTSPGMGTENDQKNTGDSVHAGNTLVSGAGISQLGHGRSLLPGEFGQHGWASNPGSCLFSCNSGSFGQNYGPPVSCCQLNYVQCCPNQHHEQWNFKNLHHGRGHVLGNGIAKSGFGWGSVPYNPPPIIKPRPCVPYHQHHHFPQIHPIPTPVIGGGSIIHKGIETIKHNIQHIGQIVKGSVGGGWGSGGNGASGYYFHRRSDNEVDVVNEHGTKTASKKTRVKRSINQYNGWGQGGYDQLTPCPVYSAQAVHPRPYPTGLGSLIGWSKPGNHIHGNYGAGYYGSVSYPPIQTQGNGYGWGSGESFCKSDFECPGHLKCCLGSCQVAPHLH